MDSFAFADSVRGYRDFGMLKKRRSGGQMFFPNLSRLHEKFVVDKKIRLGRVFSHASSFFILASFLRSIEAGMVEVYESVYVV